MLRNTLLFSTAILVVFGMSMPAAGVWMEVLKTDADDPLQNSRFGIVTAVDDGIAIVGAHQSNGNQGMAYLFDVTTGDQLAAIAPPSPAGDSFFGYSVDIDGNTAVIGEARRDGWRGAAHIYDISIPSAPVVVASHYHADPPAPFGHDVAVSGNTVLIGARGSVAVGVYNATTGAQITTIAPPGGAQDFGNMVSIDGNIASISDPDNNSVHLYDLSTPASPVAGAVLNGSGGGFGFGNDRSGDLLAIGDMGWGGNQGLVRLYDVSDINAPVELWANAASVGSADNLGYSVGVDGTHVVAGRRDDTAWVWDIAGNELQTLTASDGGAGFGGQGVSIDGLIVVGAEGADGLDVDNNVVSQSGAVYVFAVPEPSSLVLLTIGAFGLAAFAWRRKR